MKLTMLAAAAALTLAPAAAFAQASTVGGAATGAVVGGVVGGPVGAVVGAGVGAGVGSAAEPPREVVTYVEAEQVRAAAFEEVTVTRSALTVRKVSHNGRAREWSLNPLWARLEKDEYEEYGIARLFLVSHGKSLTIASFLGPDEKAGFAEALTRALGDAKRGSVRAATS